MVNGYLVTNFHVIYPHPPNSIVVLRTYDSNPEILLDGILIISASFESLTETASDDIHDDYIVLNIPELREKKLYNFILGSPKSKRIGDNIFFLGYPFEHRNLVCHTGAISSFYKDKNVDVIQIDGSVNASNSGGPLIDPVTSEVIGIITRKSTGLTQSFDQLRSIIEENIKMLTQEGFIATAIIGNIDLIQGMRHNQHQMLIITHEIQRSANVGIGYAFSIEPLKNENVFYAGEQP
jgi:S1-C subfamily serine protease